MGEQEASEASEAEGQVPGAQSAAVLLRAGLRQSHVEAALVEVLDLTEAEARAVVSAVAEALPATS
jgi:hypothetical protein